jgi:hypothetical protein
VKWRNASQRITLKKKIPHKEVQKANIDTTNTKEGLKMKKKIGNKSKFLLIKKSLTTKEMILNYNRKSSCRNHSTLWLWEETQIQSLKILSQSKIMEDPYTMDNKLKAGQHNNTMQTKKGQFDNKRALERQAYSQQW